MKEVKFQLKLNDQGLYNVSDILKNLEEYLGIDFEEAILLFKDLQIASLTEITTMIKTSNIQFQEDILRKNYQYLKKYLTILQKKGLAYLSLLEYLQRIDHCDTEQEEPYEKQLEECQIFHFRSILVGYDLKRLLIGLGHTFHQTQKYLQEITTPETYRYLLVDSFALSYGESKIYPEESLINSENNRLDKTSIYPTKRKKIGNY